MPIYRSTFNLVTVVTLTLTFLITAGCTPPDDNTPDDNTQTEFSIGGTISGVTGNQTVVVNNGIDALMH